MTGRRFVLRTLKVLGVLVLASCFGDGTGPDEGRRGSLSLLPPAEFSSLFLEFDDIHVVLTEPVSGEVVLDTTFTFPAGADSLVLTLDVPGTTIGTDLTLLMQLIDQPSGDTIFTIGPATVVPGAADGAGEPQTLPPPIYVGVGSNAVGVRFVSTAAEVYLQDSVTLVAEAFDGSNAVVPLAPIRWTSSDTTVAFLRADSTGRVVARTVRGGVTITAGLLRTSPTVTPPSVSHALAVQPRAASLAIQAGNGQTGTVGSALPQQITARVLAADGLGVQGIPVTFAVTVGGGSLSAPADTTDANGDARVTWTLGTTAGAQSVTANVPGVAGATVNIGATGSAAAATRLEFLSQPTNTEAGDPITPPVSVRARDQFNNVATLTGPVTIELLDNPGGSTLGGTTMQNASGNVATFSDLTINNAGNSYTLRAFKPGFDSDTSGTFDVVATAPVALAFTVEPTTSAAGAVISPAIEVSARDIGGNTATGYTGDITIAIGNNPGAGTLSGTTTRAAVNGVATFDDLSITTRGAGYTLTASAAGLAGATSQSFDQTALTLTWTNPAGGSWSNPANWSLGRVPQTTDSVVIAMSGTYTVSLDTTFAASYLILGGGTGTQTLLLSGRSLTVSGSMEIEAGGVFLLSGATVTGNGTLVNDGGTLSLIYGNVTAPLTLHNRGLLVTNGSSNVTGPLFTNTSSTIRMLPDGSTGFSTLTVASGFVNNGALELTSTGSTYSATLAVTAGTLTNSSGATINTIQGSGGTRTIDAALDNQGVLTVDQPLAMSRANAVHSNTGTINVADGWALTQSGSGSFTNTGTITIAPGMTWTISGGVLHQSGGSIGGAGTLALASTTANFTTDFDNGTTGLSVSSSTINGPGTITNAAGHTLTMHYGTIGATAALVNEGLLVTNGTSAINGPFTNAAGSTLRLQPDGSTGFSTTTIANGFVNDGAIELTAVGSTYSATLAVSSGTLINAPGGTITSVAGSLGSRTLTAQLDNQGTLTLLHPLTMNAGNALHSNSGTMDLSAGSLSLNQSGGAPSFTNTGTVTIGAGQTFAVSNGVVNQNGALGGPGTLSLASATMNLAGNFSNATTGLVLSSATINGPGTVTNAAGRTLMLYYSTIGATSALINDGTLLSNGTSAVTGPLTMASGSTLRLLPDGATGFTNLTVANGFTNNGAIELSSAGSTYTSNLIVTAGTLTNAPGATITSVTATGGSRSLTAQLDNQGTLTILQPMTLFQDAADHSNSGTIDASAASWTLNQGGVTPSFTNTGTITIGAGHSWTISNGTLNQNAGSIAGAGTLILSAVTANFGTNFTNATTGLIVGSSTLNGPGAITNAAGRTLTLFYSTIGASSALINDGLVVVNGTSAINGPLTTSAGSTLRLQPDGSTGFATLTVDSAFTNNGAIELTSIASTYSATLVVTGGTLTNAAGGTITSVAGAFGSRTLTAELNNLGLVTIDHPLLINGSSADHSNSGTIDVVGGDLSVTQGGTSPTFINAGTMTVAAGRTLTFSGGLFTQQAAATLSGAGALTLSSATGDILSSFTLGALTLSSSTANLASGVSTAATAVSVNSSTINGPGTITNAPGQTLTLYYGTIGATSGLDNQGLVLANGTSNINGPLTTAAGSTIRLRPDGSTGFSTLTVDSSFTNNGAIELTAITSAYSATLAVAGTLTNAAGGTITSVVSTGGSRTLQAELNNQGLVTIDQPLTINGASADHVNGGTIDVAGGNLTLTQTGTTPSFLNAGTVTVGAGRVWAISGGAFTHQSGATLSGAGTLSLANVVADLQDAYALPALIMTSSTVNLASSVSTAATALTVNNSTINGPGLVVNGAGQTLSLHSSTIGATSGLDNFGTVLTNGTTTINGPFSTAAGSILRIQPDGSTGFSNFAVDSSFTNNGSIELTAVTSAYSATLTVAGTVLNAPGGTITSLAGSGGSRTISAELINQGLVTIDQPLLLNGASADHNNTGTINLAGGNFSLTQSGTTPSFTNAGTIDVGAGRTWVVSGGSLTQQLGATLSGSGSLNLANVTADLQTPFTLAALDMTSSTVSLGSNLSTATTALGMASSTINGPGIVINDAGETLNLFYGTIGATSGLDNFGTVVSNGTSAINGPLNTALGSLIQLRPDGSTGFSNLAVDSSFTNNGTIELTSVTSAYSATLSVAGTLTNAAGGTLLSSVGSLGSRTFAGELNNEGLVIVNQPLTMNSAGVDHVNTGTIDATNAALSINQSGTTPTFTNAGVMTIGAGLNLTITGGTFTHQGGATLNGSGALNLGGSVTADMQGLFGVGAIFSNGATLNLGNNVSTGTMPISLISTTVNGPGTITNAAGQTLTMREATIAATSGLTNQGIVVTNGNGAINGPFTTAAGSILRLEPNSLTGFATLQVLGGFTNNGAVELTSQVSTYYAQISTVGGTITNAPGGTINAMTGTGGARYLSQAPVDNQGTLTVEPGPGGAGVLTINTSLTTSANLNLQLGGTTLGTQYSQVSVGNGATVGGTLNVSLVNGFTPSIGDSFTILTRLSGGGAFTTTNLPALGAGTWQIAYNTGSIVLSVVP